MFGEDGSKFVVFALVLTLFCDRTSSECAQLTPCSCIFPNGQGYNLTQLGGSRNFTASANGQTFYFHPCSNIQMINGSECYNGTGVSLCLVNKNKTISLGTVEETTINIESESSTKPALTLRHGSYTTVIRLLCCNSCNTHLVSDSIDSDKDYHLLLMSPYACQSQLRTKGLSTGSLLVIYLFVFTALYFVGGAIALKWLRGATGREMIANYSFWRELPSLVRDGIAFTFSCGRGDSYERI
ncbi:Cation-dependent mannose-6-phosphate receptor [Dufourea novaeangliae]|uniref:Autophagy-related protein 27 n=2 Tax=Dufourea novaeangliae TaxID=178035 RepID=A0A154PBV1_DUFNO|nr:Cation-dependent mannose-6-phosphate receptor [Dufourea novaeangliae]